MILSIFFIVSKSIVAGIDYGNENIKIGIAFVGKGVHVALNQQNKRLSPSYFAIWNTTNPNQTQRNKHLSISEVRSCSWDYNERAYSHFLKYPQNAFKGLKNFADNYNGLTRREASAILLRHIFSTMDNSQHLPNSVYAVFAIDPDYPCINRYMLHEIIKMSGAHLKSIIDSPSAVANLYALEKSQLYNKSPKTVVFFDVGAEKSWMSVFSFKKIPSNPIVKQLSLITNIPISGSMIDERLANYFIQLFSKENNFDFKLPLKARLAFVDSARRIKERLSLHESVDVKIEDVYMNKSFETTITKEVFENLLQDFNKTITDSYLELIDRAHLTRSEIDGIELIGGSTRIPLIQDILIEVSGIIQLNRTMNSDEAIALGAAYIGAAQSADLFASKKVTISSFINTNVYLNHSGNIISLFNKTNRNDDTASYEYKAANNTEIAILVGDNESTSEELVSFLVKLPETAKPNVTIHVDFGFDELMMPGIFNIMLNRQTTHEIEFKHPKWAMSQLDYNRSLAFIKKMDDVTQERKETQMAYNDFESYLYGVKKRFENDSIIQTVTTNSEREKLLKNINKDMTWLLNGPHKMPLTARIIQNRMESLKTRIDEIELRASELPKREPAFQKLWNKIEECKIAMNETWPRERPWMPEKARNRMKDAIDHAVKYYHIYKNKQGNKTATENPEVLAQEIDQQTMYLEMTYNFTLKKTKNPPTPKPPKTPNPYVRTFNTIDDYERDLEKQYEKDFFGI